MIDTLEKHQDISVAVPVLKELNSDRIESFFTHVYLTPLTDFVSDYYEDEVERRLDRLTTMVEPLMMMTMGLLIGGIVVAMYIPIFQMAGTVQ